MWCSERPVSLRGWLRVFALWMTLLAPAALAADGAGIVLVSAREGNLQTLELSAAQELYLGQRTRIADGPLLTVVDLPSGPVRDQFYQHLTGKNPSQIRAYWSRLVFTGRARPPHEVAGPEHAIELVLRNPNALAYLPASLAEHPGLKVLLRLDQVPGSATR